MTRSIATRRSLHIVLTVLLCGFIAPSLATGLVFEVSRPGMPTGYLVGTLHSEDPRVIALVPALAPVIARIDALAVELVPDAVTMVAVAAASMLPAGQDLAGRIGEARFDALREIARERQIPVEVLMRLKPWAAAVTLGMPPTDSGRFLDMELYLAVAAQGRRTLGLETAAEQLAVFGGIPESTQIAMVDDLIKNAADLPKELEALTRAWLAGDLARLEAVARRQNAMASPAVIHWLDEVVVRARNERMLERALPLLREGPVMVAVGALHLAGDSGLVAGLRRHGYTVEPWPGAASLSPE